jgi:outer membrane receptor for monomeric catechols
VTEPVTAINAATIELTPAVSLEDYLSQVPGVSFDQARAGQTKVTFRGINAGDVNATAVDPNLHTTNVNGERVSGGRADRSAASAHHRCFVGPQILVFLRN